MAAVTFSYAYWIAAYPEFAGCSQDQGQAWFDRAGLIFTNTTYNPAYPDNLSPLLYLLTSHIGWLNAPRDANGNPATTGQAPSPIVGRINSASEGSVSVGAEWKGSGSPSEDWYIQTRYGAEFWQATAQYRTARYIAHPTIVSPGIFPYVPSYRRY
jgi:hypothetical protein